MDLARLGAAAAILLPLLCATPTLACVDGIDERLQIYCLLNEVSEKRIPPKIAYHVDALLKQQGYPGIGLPQFLENPHYTLALGGSVYYSDNINGGNSPRPLTLGNITLEGDSKLYRKEGVVAGPTVGFSGRYVYGQGRYFDIATSVSHTHSPHYDVGITSESVRICSVNHVASWWFIDACADANRVRKDLTDETIRNISLAGAHVLQGNSHTYAMVRLGVNRHFEEAYTQNQVVLGLDAIYKGGSSSTLSLTFGDSVRGQLATRFALSIATTKIIWGRSLTASFAFSDALGGMLLGYPRNEKNYNLGVSYPVWGNLMFNIGYKVVDSNIDYFDSRSPTISLQTSPIRF